MGRSSMDCEVVMLASAVRRGEKTGWEDNSPRIPISEVSVSMYIRKAPSLTTIGLIGNLIDVHTYGGGRAFAVEPVY